MAYSGELVKLADGRWARFQRCEVLDAKNGPALMAAVELEERYQRLLNAAESSLARYQTQGVPVQVRLDEEEENVRFAESLSAAF